MENMLDRVKGCLFGQAIGDALGGRYEFKTAIDVCEDIDDDRDPVTKFLPILGGGGFNLDPGQVTDDTELAMAMVRSLLRMDGYDAGDVARSYVHWYRSNPFDIGNTTSQALQVRLNDEKKSLFTMSSSKANFNEVTQEQRETLLQQVLENAKTRNKDSLSNGCLMRISPLAIAGVQKNTIDLSTVLETAAANCRLTNPNPVAVDAVRVYVAAVRQLLIGGNPKDAYELALSLASTATVRDHLKAAEKAALPVVVDKKNGIITHGDDCAFGYLGIALQCAFYEMLHADDFETALVRVVAIGGDTDTNGCIAGAMLGARFGASKIPDQWKNTVVKAEPSRLTDFPDVCLHDLELVTERLANMEKL